MFERFTEKARRVIFFSRYQASQFGSSVIDTEHLLLGILRESPKLITSIAKPDTVSAITERIRQQCPVRDKISTTVEMPFSESAKNVLLSATDEADQQQDRAIKCKHLLIGLLREEGCLSQKILAEHGVTVEAIRRHSSSSGGEAVSNVLGAGVRGKPVPNQGFQKIVTDAIDEAGLLRSISAKPEHLLLGMLRNEDSLAAKILREAGLDYESVRRKLEENN